MALSQTIIKVSDLLLQTGKKDTVTFSWLHVSWLEWMIDAERLSWSVSLQSIPDGIIAQFNTISATCLLQSDYSWKEFSYPISVPTYTVTYRADFDKNSEHAYDEEFPLETKNKTIDLSLPLEQTIRLQLPVVALAPWEVLQWTDDY